MSREVLSVGQINEYIRLKMDSDVLLSGLAVRGEISNYKVYPSGHHYFSLKDETGALRCVMFRTNAVSLKFRPEDGVKVIAMGKISVFPRDGAYQLYCTAIIPDGVGELYVAFEQLKKKLAARGLFDPEHKKPLPKYPKTICIITSEAGAAIHDMLRVLNKRYPLVKVNLLPVRVQGAEAPGEIASAVQYANHYALGDLLIVGRGGGSMEDLWAFNDEQVALAVYESHIPVISAVGHEPDVTTIDYVADLRAATPSNGAELAVPDKEAIMQTLDSLQSAMFTSVSRSVSAARRQLGIFTASNALKSPDSYLVIRRNSLETLENRLSSAQCLILSRRKQRYLACTAKLDALSPLKVLTRGYAIVQDSDSNIIRSTKQVKPGDSLSLTVSSGKIFAEITDVKENDNGK